MSKRIVLILTSVFLMAGAGAGCRRQTAPNPERAQLERLRPENKDLAKLRAENLEVRRLEAATRELPKLRGKYQQAKRLRQENEKLLAELNRRQHGTAPQK